MSLPAPRNRAKRVLSDRVVASLPAGSTVPDHEVDGLAIVVAADGRKRWRWERWGVAAGEEKPRSLKLAIGEYSIDLDTDAARKIAKRLNADLARGLDPRLEYEKRAAAEKAASEAAARELEIRRLGSMSVAKLSDLFLRRGGISEVWEREQARIFDRFVLPVIGNRDVRELKRADVVALVDPLLERGKRVQANRAASTIQKFFGWCEDRGTLEANPCPRRFRPGGQEWERHGRGRRTLVAPNRAYSDAELALLWRAFTDLGAPFGPMLQIAVLTGMRRGELRKARWQDLADHFVDPDTQARLEIPVWNLPRTKQGGSHAVPITPTVARLLAELPRVDSYVFSNASGRSVNWQRAAHGVGKTTGIESFRPHGLRHVFHGRISALASIEIAEAAVGHALPAMAGTYSQSALMTKVAAAMTEWDAKLEAITKPA